MGLTVGDSVGDWGGYGRVANSDADNSGYRYSDADSNSNGYTHPHSDGDATPAVYADCPE